ncbi:MAG: hypothetical protein AAGF85_15135, partial [Bacteroidota bacterium]
MIKTFRTFFPALFLCFISLVKTIAQDNLLNKEIMLTKNTGSIEQLLREISDKGGFNFTYSNQILIDGEFTLKGQKQSVSAYLDQLFPN